MHEDQTLLEPATDAPVSPDPLPAGDPEAEESSAPPARALVILFVVLLFLLVAPTVLGVQGPAGGCGGG